MRIRATIVIEYDANPDHYGTNDPAEMARIDIATDPAFVLDASDWTVTAEEVPA